ncbi:hypothetical protein ACFV3E_41970 [Streptomyces sp. NPDC059718]
MSPDTAHFDMKSVLQEVKMIRAEGLVRIRDLHLPLLRRAAAQRSTAVADAWPLEVEMLLRAAVSLLGGGTLQEAAAYTLGLAPGTRDLPAGERRARAAKVYSISVERFRKSHEEMVLAQVAEHICWITGSSGTSHGSVSGLALLPPHLQHHRLRVGTLDLVLHVHPVELLHDVDVIVSPTNTHLGLPAMFKSSVSASLRRAAAIRDPTGDVIHDPLHHSLHTWRTDNGIKGHPVPPGTVAPTEPGALNTQGIRRIYHAAIATPKPGTNHYDVMPGDVARAASRAVALMAEERDNFAPPLRSICFTLLGAGRGGLRPETSLIALWGALAAGPVMERQVHLVVRRPMLSDLVIDTLGAQRMPPAPSTGTSHERKEPTCG